MNDNSYTNVEDQPFSFRKRRPSKPDYNRPLREIDVDHP